MPAVTASVTIPARVGTSASTSEKNASSSTSATTLSSGPPLAPKLRSCIVCRSRKVRCDKQSPCSTCRRANIACVFPSNNRPPRWARRLERVTNDAIASNAAAPPDTHPGVEKVMDRIRNLESLVKELRGQLEQAHAAAGLGSDGPHSSASPGSSAHDHDAEFQRDTSPTANTSRVQRELGRLVLQDASRSRYVSSGFWSWVNDEVSRSFIIILVSYLHSSLTLCTARWAKDGYPWPGRGRVRQLGG